MPLRRLRPYESPVQLLALELVLAGALGSVLVVTSNLHDSEIVAGTWAVVGVIGWWLPLFAAAFLMMGAVVGLLAAFVAAFTGYYLGGRRSESASSGSSCFRSRRRCFSSARTGSEQADQRSGDVAVAVARGPNEVSVEHGRAATLVPPARCTGLSRRCLRARHQ
jgi:hypothetical protein